MRELQRSLEGKMVVGGRETQTECAGSGDPSTTLKQNQVSRDALAPGLLCANSYGASRKSPGVNASRLSLFSFDFQWFLAAVAIVVLSPFFDDAVTDLKIPRLRVGLGLSSSLFADDAVPLTEDKTKEKPTNEPVPEDKPNENSILDKVSDELFKKDDASKENSEKPGEKVDKMERAVKGMRSAGDKLDEGVTADDTQKIQKQVIKDLEDIIDQLENPPPDQGGGGGGGGGGGNGASGRSRKNGGGSPLRLRRPQGMGGKGMKSGQQQQNQANDQEKNGGQNSEDAKDSSKSQQATKKAAEEAERRRKLEMDIWGHLPEHLREELLSTYGERMLPKYEQLVKQFYEALSTQGDPKKK